MGLIIHESAHIIISSIIGFFLWKKWEKFCPAFSGAIIGGFLLDLDHLFDYFLAFAFKFNLSYFLKGYQFMKNDKIYVPLHAWEWFILLLIIVYVINKNAKIKSTNKYLLLSILFSFSLALFSHLIIDVNLNHVTIPGYSIIYRIKNNFELKKLVSPDHYKNHIKKKNIIKL